MPKTNLVADDNPAIRKMICKMFEREQDFELCAEASQSTGGNRSGRSAQARLGSARSIDARNGRFGAARRLKEIIW